MKTKLFFATLLISVSVFSQTEQQIELVPGEKIWSGVIDEGHIMPYENLHQFDMYGNNLWNQVQPLIISNKGLWVWSEDPYKFQIKDNLLIISNVLGKIETGRNGNSLAGTQKFVANMFFPASGKLPDELLFAAPQYNTWIELTYNQNQEDVLKYAKAIIENGLTPGVLMIDDTWQEDYGKWTFHPGRFHDPKGMISELHKMGFKVMLWVCPFVSADQYLIVHEIMKNKGFLLQKTDENTTWETATTPASINWWNGQSALLDFSNSAAVNWFNTQLDYLVNEFGIDGFKLDAGDFSFYPPTALSKEPATPNQQSELFAKIGLRYPLNEYRACWKMAGQPLVQRLRDKNHSWEDLQNLVPNMIAEGLAGYTFSCPDMIGGGEFKSFLPGSNFEQDLVVRSAQTHALMPMMQFSVAPWRVLDEAHFNAVKKSVEIRAKFTPLILDLARKSSKTGEPIMSNLEYYFPNQGLETITDQFMLGENVLVAPMVQKGNSRKVVLPKGNWKADDGKTYKGGKTIEIEVPLQRLPYFEMQK
jgi:alpha-glucosidase